MILGARRTAFSLLNFKIASAFAFTRFLVTMLLGTVCYYSIRTRVTVRGRHVATAVFGIALIKIGISYAVGSNGTVTPSVHLTHPNSTQGLHGKIKINPIFCRTDGF